MRPTAKSDERSERKKLQLKYLRDFVTTTTTTTASVDGGKFGVELTCPHRPPPICSPLLPPCATCVEELKLHSEIEPRSVRLIALQSVASIECAFHRPVRIRDRRIHIGTVELRVLLINIVIYLSYISSQLWTLCRGRPCSHLKFYRSEITDN